MTLPSAPAIRAWRELAALAAGDGAERSLVERLLDTWRADTATPALGLYLPTEQGWRLEASAGAGGLAERLAQPLPANQPSLRLGEALIAWPAAVANDVAPPESPLAELLAVAVRGLSLRRQLKERGFEANYRGVELEALYDVGLAIASTLDLDRLCEEILMRAVSLLDARRGALYLLDGRMLRLNRAFGGGALPVVDTADNGGSHLLQAGDSAAVTALVPGATFVLGVPVAIDAVPRGLLVVADKEDRRGVGPFRESDRRTLGLLANQAAIALENANLHRQALEKERLEREIELASEIQRSILPKGVPDVPGYALAGWNRPARHIGGDYFDFFRLRSGRLAVTVGDVSGKGVPAALLVSTLHSALHLLTDRAELGPELFVRLNEHVLASSAPNKFITLLVVDLDPTSGELTYLNAGHNPGLLVRANGEVVQMRTGGLPIGLLRDVSYRTEDLRLDPGDLFCLYSDGITEATSADDEEFGLERLADLLVARRGEPLEAIVREIDRLATDFVDGAPQGDDQTVVLLRRDP
ncbi:MAG: SpoIIE family protein phosphatase [Holophagales bacterium]|nr:MAG: SpoIIE family protein phosphatase [Holophagales bacterium]